MTRLAITWLTFVALAVALVMGVLWLTTAPAGDRLEPAVNSLAVLAGITGIFVERWAAQRERRNQALESIHDELERNAVVLDDDAFATTAGAHRRLYPRLIRSAVDAAFSTGALDRRGDGDLVVLLHRWRDSVGSVNRRLELTEMLLFTTSSNDEIVQFNQALHGPASVLHDARELLGTVRARVARASGARRPGQDIQDQRPLDDHRAEGL